MTVTRRLAAILAADVVGYSGLTERTLERLKHCEIKRRVPRPHSQDRITHLTRRECHAGLAR
jgi:hypothetical protein